MPSLESGPVLLVITVRVIPRHYDSHVPRGCGLDNGGAVLD